jgi:DNA-binding NarL/FixJ family response regulator
MKKIRVLLADDHRIVLEGLRGLLEPEFEIVGTVGGFGIASALVRRHWLGIGSDQDN